MTAGAGPRWSVRGPVALGGAMLAVLVLCIGTWAAFAELSGAVIASGRVEVEQDRQVVQHLHGGVVAEILVADGQEVAEGEVLLRLDGGSLLPEWAIVETQFLETLARRGRLAAERDGAEAPVFPPLLVAAAADRPDAAQIMEGQAQLFAARAASFAQRLEQIDRRRDQLSEQIAGIDAQLAATAVQADLIGQELGDQQTLFDRGLSPEARLLALRREAARLDGTIGSLRAERARVEAALTELGVERLTFDTLRREQAQGELRDLAVRELELAERLRILRDRIDALDIRAPTGGVVFDLAVTTPRAVIRPAEPILFIVPQDRPLIVTVQVRPEDVDQVFVGQQATLVLSAFGLHETREVAGRVEIVSADALTDPATGARYFRVDVLPDPQQAGDLSGRGLLPGMPVEAFLRTRARSPFDYLVEPVAIYLSRALREG